MYQFITIPKEYASDYRERRITKPERQMLEWLRQLANPYGIAVVDLGSLANDCLSRGVDKNYANKVLLSLKRKRYIYYEERSGRRGSFEVHQDWWPLPNKGKTGLPAIRRITGLFGGKDTVRGDGATDTLDTSEVHTEVDEQKQRSDDVKDAIDALDNVFSIEPSFRGSYTDTDKEKENETNRPLAPFNKNAKKRNLSVDTFRPQSDEEEELRAIAIELDETDMAFLLGTKTKHGLVVINRVLDHCRSSGALTNAENKAALFNSILQRFVTEGYL